MFGSMGQTNVKNLGNGGTMDGDVTITGDLTVSGGIALTLNEVLQGTSTIDINSTEALLVRKDGDGGDVFTVDTTNSIVTTSGDIKLSGNDKNISWGSDAHNMIYGSSSGDYLKLQANNQLKLTLNSTGAIFENGNVGIGSSSPISNVEIKGTISSLDGVPSGLVVHDSGTANSGLQLINNSGKFAIHADGANDRVDFYLDDATTGSSFAGSDKILTLKYGGNVGIGTDSPTLTAGTGLNLSDANVGIRLSATGAGGWGFIEYQDNAGTIQFIQGYRDTDETFRINASDSLTNTDGITISNAGNVGIGTASPSEALHISSSEASATPVLLLENTNANNLAPQINLYKNTSDEADGDKAGQIDFEGNDSAGNRTTYSRIITEQYRVLSGAEDGIMDLQVAVDGTLANGIRIRGGTGARVGIGSGATNPSEALEVNGSGANLKVVSDDNVYLSLDSTQTNGDEWQIFNANSGSTSTLQFKNVDQSKVVMLMDETGKVGIGTVSPSDYLADADDLVVASSGNTGITIASTGTDQICKLVFADGTSGTAEYIGQVAYDHNGNTMTLGTNGTDRLTIDSSGKVGIGNSSPASALDIKGTDNTSSKITITNTSGTDNIWSIHANYNTQALVFTGDSTEVMTLLDSGASTFTGTITIDSNATDGTALTIDSEAQDGQGIYMDVSQQTTGYGININDVGTSRTTGGIIYINSNQNNAGTRNLVHIINEHANATGTTALFVKQDASQQAVKIDQNGNGDGLLIATDATTRHGLYVDGSSFTTGNGAYIYSNASNDSTRNLMLIINDHTGATGATGLKIQQDSTAPAIHINAGGNDVMKVDSNSRISLSNNDDGASGRTYNTVFGYLAGDDLENTGNYNSFFGDNSGHAVTVGDYNCAFGLNSLDGSTHADRVTAIGSASMRGAVTADAQGAVGVGYATLNGLTSGAGNVAVGYEAGYAITSGGSNVAIGSSALRYLVTGGANVAIGRNAGQQMGASENGNILIGMASGQALDEGTNGTIDSNIAIGKDAFTGGDLNTGATAIVGNIAIGTDALNSTGTNAQTGTIAIGHQALTTLTSGTKNTVIGYKAGESYNGSNSVIIGYEAGLDVDGGSGDSTLIGMEAGKHLDDGTFNTAIGAEAMKSTGTSNTAIRNTCIGWRAGDLLRTGSDNVVIGHGAEVSATDAVNQISIGKETQGKGDNTVALGNTSVTDVYMAEDAGAKVHARALTLQDTSAFQMSIEGYNGVPAVIDFASAKGTIASPTDIDEANYILGRIRFLGYESSVHRTGAEIRGYTEGVWDGNTYNTYLSFMTVPNDNTATATEKLRVTSSNVELTSGQLKFPASQSASSDANTLDDYEEGTWTPIVKDGQGTPVAFTAGSGNAGTYTKVGRMVTCNAFCVTNGDNSASGFVAIHGLPFAQASGSDTAVTFGNYENFAITAGHSINGNIYDTNQYIGVYVADSTGGSTNMSVAEWSPDGRAYLSVTYFTD